jgi:hypothetical protein
MSRLERMAALFEKDNWGVIPSHWFSIAAQIQQGTTGPEQWNEEDYIGAKTLLSVWRASKCRRCAQQ